MCCHEHKRRFLVDSAQNFGQTQLFGPQCDYFMLLVLTSSLLMEFSGHLVKFPQLVLEASTDDLVGLAEGLFIGDHLHLLVFLTFFVFRLMVLRILVLVLHAVGDLARAQLRLLLLIRVVVHV